MASVLLQPSFSQSKIQNNICDKWNELDHEIVNQTIDVDDAVDLMEEYEPLVKKYFKS